MRDPISAFLFVLILVTSMSVCEVAECRSLVIPDGIPAGGGNNNDDGPLGSGVVQRGQYVFGASHLGELSPGDQIAGLTFRVEENLTGVPPQTVGNYEIMMSTSANAVGSLDLTFENNLSSDAVLVRAGELQIDEGDFPGSESPNAFGKTITFDQPFTFTSAPLLIDITHDGFSLGGRLADAEFLSARDYGSVFGRGYQAEQGDLLVDFTAVIQLEIADAPCDINGDGVCDAADIDTLTQQVLDGTITQSVRTEYIQGSGPESLNTWIGDSNLDGQFDEQDYVAAFVAGKYATGQHAGWENGDWNGNFLFDEQDFVAAFIAGGYLQGPRAVAVPEPTALGMVLVSIVGLLSVQRRQQ